jgi:16S rRNA (guanine527-N7)-methyltransferase
MSANRKTRIDGPDAFIREFSVSRETANRLNRYEELLLQWQKAVNLVAPGTLGDIWHRHFADSAQVARLVPAEAQSLMDMGAGGGFPGLVLAIILSEHRSIRVTLVESDIRKGAFLREVARQTGTAVDILSARIEKPETQGKVSQVDVITARALAPLGRLLSLSAPYFAPNSVGLFLKGRDIQGEIDDAKAGWRFDITLVDSVTDAEGRIAVVRNVAAKTEG